MHKYEEQLERVARYYARIERMYAGQPHTGAVEELIDDAYAFFQNCYHVKDWLKNDPNYTKHSPREIEAYVTATPALSLCADLCNGLKHLDLRKVRSGAAPVVKGRRTIIDFGDDPATIQNDPSLPRVTIRLPIEHAGQMLDALEIARGATEAWQSFV